MALASVDLLAGVVAAWPASFGRLHALGVDDCTRRTGLTPRPFTIEHNQCVINLREAVFVTELRKPAIDRAPRRQIARQQAPRAARSHHIEDPVDDLAHRPSAWSARGIRRRKVGPDHAPFLIGHVGLVSARLANMLLAGGWGPHGGSGVGLSNPLESHSTPATQPISKRPLSRMPLEVDVNGIGSGEMIQISKPPN